MGYKIRGNEKRKEKQLKLKYMSKEIAYLLITLIVGVTAFALGMWHQRMGLHVLLGYYRHKIADLEAEIALQDKERQEQARKEQISKLVPDVLGITVEDIEKERNGDYRIIGYEQWAQENGMLADIITEKEYVRLSGKYCPQGYWQAEEEFHDKRIPGTGC